MRFRSLDATFGKLERRALAFTDGLNIVQAPNEAGKSTIAAFLRAMLYGLPTRDRGALADKNRYAPWSGAPMQGALTLETAGYGEITLRRDTARANAPMGRFSATYAGTGEPVAALSAADCGETLLGVPREVYERSAFIRQSGLAVDADAELERRIAALITTGEEGASYSEAAATLKKRLNARRANSRVGQIPTLERELEADKSALAEQRALLAERVDAEEALTAARDAEAELRAALEAHDLADRQARNAERERAERDAADADAKAAVARGMIADAKTPPREALAQCRAKFAALDELAARWTDAADKRQEAARALRTFDALGAVPARPPVWPALPILAAALASAAAHYRFHNLAATIVCIAVTLLCLLAFGVAAIRHRGKWRVSRERRAQLEAGLRDAEAAVTALDDAHKTQLAAILDQLPAGDAAYARAYVDEALTRYAMLDTLEREANEARVRADALAREPLGDVPAAPVERPTRTREELRFALERMLDRRAEAQSRIDRATGRLQALGGTGELEAALAEKRGRLETLQAEYDALALALEALDHANAALQTRFSPELGRRAAEYFSALTGGKYGAVLLDRSFRALATETGDSAARDAAQLSQGAADQLYLAVRLAICDMVLPPENGVPLVLDDALINFDDARCRAALDLLYRIAEARQILLLTCQHREAAYINGRKNVNILTL